MDEGSKVGKINGEKLVIEMFLFLVCLSQLKRGGVGSRFMAAKEGGDENFHFVRNLNL